MLNCPNPECPYFLKYGKPYPRAHYKIKKTNKKKPRENFEAKCPRCGHEWDDAKISDLSKEDLKLIKESLGKTIKRRGKKK